MTSNLLGFLKRLVFCVTFPIWIPLAAILLIVIYLGTLVVGFGQWLFTGKKTILQELDRPYFV